MQHLDLLLALMTLVAGLYTLSQRWNISFPILLVLGGMLLGLIPGTPSLTLHPDVAFLIFLPPLLFDAAWHTSWTDFKKHSSAIGRLAIGLVLFTTVAVALCAHYLIPGFSWPLAFLLGAIVSPPDAIATTSALKGIRLPKRLLTILEGESLINDASALIAYRYALLAVMGGGFVLWKASLSFLLVAGLGVGIGFLVGLAFEMAQKHILGNPTVETSVTLLLPFISYLLAEHMGASGVLSVVTTGLFISWHSHKIFSYRTRMQANGFWDTLAFMLNGLVFLLIGLQLPTVAAHISHHSMKSLVMYGLLISLVTIVVRILWIFPTVHLADRLHRWRGDSLQNDITTDNRHLAILSWSGMRGVVSLATAMALPLTLPNGDLFPERNAILVITFMVILITLVVQGLTLPWLVKTLKVFEPENKSANEERRLRLALTRDSLQFIKSDLARQSDPKVIQEITSRMERQTHYLTHVLDGSGHLDADKSARQLYQYLKTEREVIEHQRQLLVALYRKGTMFSSETIRKVERDVDIWSLSLESRLKAFRKPEKS